MRYCFKFQLIEIEFEMNRCICVHMFVIIYIYAANIAIICFNNNVNSNVGLGGMLGGLLELDLLVRSRLLRR